MRNAERSGIAKQQRFAGQLPSAERIRRIATGPLLRCRMSPDLWERGRGLLLIARGTSTGQVATAMLLLDPWCLGIKQVLVRLVSAHEADVFMAGPGMPLVDVAPGVARQAAEASAAYGRSLGFSLPTELAAAEAMIADVPAGEPAPMRFGQDGKPLYAPTFEDSPGRVQRMLSHLRNRLGTDGFRYIGLEGDFDDEDEAVAAEPRPYAPVAAE